MRRPEDPLLPVKTALGALLAGAVGVASLWAVATVCPRPGAPCDLDPLVLFGLVLLGGVATALSFAVVFSLAAYACGASWAGSLARWAPAAVGAAATVGSALGLASAARSGRPPSDARAIEVAFWAAALAAACGATVFCLCRARRDRGAYRPLVAEPDDDVEEVSLTRAVSRALDDTPAPPAMPGA